MATAVIDGPVIKIETDLLLAQVKTEGYVSGVAAGTFVDKRTSAKDLGFGLDIVDFLLEPGADNEHFEPHRYQYGDKVHGNIPKRYVELPQICTQAKKLEFEVVRGKGFVGVKQWFRWSVATAGRKPGSLWEQWLVFPEGKRYFYACDIITSANKVEHLFLRLDMPGHLKHNQGDSFKQIYLSYHGLIPASEFFEDFPPDAKFLYRRDSKPASRMIRAYQTQAGVWLAGMTLNPEIVYEAWCHQRGYVCFIQEVGGLLVTVGDRLSAAYVIGWFDNVAEMQTVYDEHKGIKQLEVSAESYKLVG
jgi:hypothetical protein